MTTVLLTGFDPFAGDARNPSGEIAARLDGCIVGGAVVRGVVLPTAYDAATQRLAALLEEHRPDTVVCLGVAKGRAAITPERIALNLDDAALADNAGVVRRETAIDTGGPDGRFSRLPVRAIADAVAAAGIPAAVSLSAGAFVCNHVFYTLLGLVSDTSIRAGFIHVPALPDPGDPEAPAMDLDSMARGITVALETLVAA
jgi:pyroglutamyl-peptidase